MRPLALLFVALFNSILGLSLLFPILAAARAHARARRAPDRVVQRRLRPAPAAHEPLLGQAERAGGPQARAPHRDLRLRAVLPRLRPRSPSWGCGATFEGVGPLRSAARLLGIVGGALSSATFPTAQAYVADVTDRDGAHLGDGDHRRRLRAGGRLRSGHRRRPFHLRTACFPIYVPRWRMALINADLRGLAPARAGTARAARRRGSG